MTYMSKELPSELLIWLIEDLKEMHYHKKNLIGRGMNESAQILTHTIDYTTTCQLPVIVVLHVVFFHRKLVIFLSFTRILTRVRQAHRA